MKKKSEETLALEAQLAASKRADHDRYVQWLMRTPACELEDGSESKKPYESQLYDLYKVLHDKFHGE